MQKKYKDDLDQLAEEGWSWFEEYNNYILSARGVLSFAQEFSGDIVSSAANALKSTMEETGAENIINIADQWGMNRTALKDMEDSETLF